ncbi:MAG: hypothetical protein RIB59_15630 [Rhodospirillales bacterium]
MMKRERESLPDTSDQEILFTVQYAMNTAFLAAKKAAEKDDASEPNAKD